MVLIIIFAATATLIACAAQIKLRGPSAIPLSLAAVVTLIGPCIWVLTSTYYLFDGAELRVRCGPLRWQIPLDQIHNVEPTRNPMSSAALSLDRLRIDYGRGKFVLVSPADKAGFLRELNARRSNK